MSGSLTSGISKNRRRESVGISCLGTLNEYRIYIPSAITGGNIPTKISDTKNRSIDPFINSRFLEPYKTPFDIIEIRRNFSDSYTFAASSFPTDSKKNYVYCFASESFMLLFNLKQGLKTIKLERAPFFRWIKYDIGEYNPSAISSSENFLYVSMREPSSALDKKIFVFRH